MIRLAVARLISVTGGADYQCASMGGAPPTGPAGVLAPLVDAGDTLYLERERKRDALRVVQSLLRR